ncbi:MAG: hypothetical protein VZS44_01795 [Bacilli bacterium]|nr:hypothetical protein [Bacilli bacterium]
MDKDYITITKTDGTMEKMEVVATFRLEESGKKCIIYKSLNQDKYYAASYDDEVDYSNLDTNFTDEEKEQLNKVFNVIKNGGEVDA